MRNVFRCNFPEGSCGHATCFLANWLADNGLKEVKYVYGKRGKQSHGWLELGEYIVDIKSD